MTSKLLFQDPSGFATPLLVVFAVDIATGKDEPGLPCTADDLRRTLAKPQHRGSPPASSKRPSPRPLLLRRPERAQGRASADRRPRQSEVPHRERAPQGRRHRDPLRPPARHPRSRHRLPRRPRARRRAHRRTSLLPRRARHRRRRPPRRLRHRHLSQRPQGPERSERHRSRFRKPTTRPATTASAAGTRASSSARARTSRARSSTSPATCSRLPNSAAAPRRWPRSIGLACEVHSTDKLKELKMGAFLARRAGLLRAARAHRPALRARRPRLRPGRSRASASSAKASPSTPAASPSSPPTTWTR